MKIITIHETGEHSNQDITIVHERPESADEFQHWQIKQGENQGSLILSELDMSRLTHALTHIDGLEG